MLHPAAPIAAGPSGDLRTAVVTCLVAADPSRRPTHLVTAGHVFPRDAKGEDATVWAVRGRHTPPVPIGRLVVNLLDRQPALDAALVTLEPEVCLSNPARAARFARTGWVPDGAAVRVMAWLPSQAGCSRMFWLAPPRGPAAFRSRIRPDGYTVSDPLWVHPCFTRTGDSGAPLLTAAAPRLGIGLAVGRLGVHAVFESLPRALAGLEQQLGRGLCLVPWDDPHRLGSGGSKSSSST